MKPDMAFPAEAEKWLWEGISFLCFLLICGALMARRFSRTASALAAGGTVLGVLALQAALLAAGMDMTLVLTLLPLTAYLPAVICLHILSGSGFFQTVAVWGMAAMAHFILDIFRKLLLRALAGMEHITWQMGWAITACLLLAAAVLVFLTFRFLRLPFRDYVLKNETNWPLLFFPAFMILLLFSYFTGSMRRCAPGWRRAALTAMTCATTCWCWGNWPGRMRRRIFSTM